MADENVSARETRRAELSKANLAAWESGGIDSDDLGSLDASLKRNTAFIKRLRTSLQAADSVSALVKEVNELSLEKYTSELVSATTEGLSRCKSGTEIAGAVEVISALHRRFPELFTSRIISALQTSLQPPARASLAALTPEQRDKDENARVLRQRGMLRIYAELELVHILRPDRRSALGDATFAVFKDLLTADKDLLVTSIPLAMAFTKHLGATFLPPASGSADPTAAEASAMSEDQGTVSYQQKEKFKKLLVAYHEALSRRAVKDHTHMLETDKRNHDAYIRSGEIFEDRAQNYEKMARSWEKLWSGVQSLSEALGLTLPTLPSLPSTTIVTGTGNSLLDGMNSEGGAATAGGIWSDDEERRFYTDLLDLRGEVPASLLTKLNDAKLEAVEVASPDVAAEKAEADDRTSQMAAADDEDDGLAPAPAAQLSALFARFSDMSNRQSIDKAAVEFAFLNSKAARRRLVKTVAAVPRTRQDLIPYYARLVAILNQYMPDVGSGVVSMLDEEFRSLQRRRAQDASRQDLAELRTKNVRFLSELTKFGVTPLHLILHVLKVSLDDFSGPSIENICTLLETCGRFLLRSELSREKMAGMLDTMKRKKGLTNLDQRYVTMLENAYYQCDPPDRPVVVAKERTPMQLFLRHLLYDVLAKATLEKVVKLLRKLHWEDPQIVRKLYNAFTKVWKVRFSNIYLFAILLHDLARHHSEFCVSVVDGVLENITSGMEHNNFKYNQQRVATVKYLGELYTYRMVDARVVLDTLWSLVTFGHPEGRPLPDLPSTIDMPNDFFRIRLVCTLLDTCGMYFDRGLLRKKMDHFLTFFQMYIKAKQPAPMDIEFMVSDTFETLRPKMPLFATFEQAAAAVDAMLATGLHNITGTSAAEIEDGEDDALRPDGLIESSDEEMDAGEPEDMSSESDSDLSDEDETSSSDVSSEEETAAGEAYNAEQDEFERELARMMAENSGDIRKAASSRSGLSEMNLPAVRRQAPEEANDDRNLKFTLLLKKGAKQQMRTMDIPRESALAMHTLSKQEQNRAEQQQLKQLVLDYEQREEAENRKQEDENRRQWVDHAARRGIKIKLEPGRL